MVHCQIQGMFEMLRSMGSRCICHPRRRQLQRFECWWAVQGFKDVGVSCNHTGHPVSPSPSESKARLSNGLGWLWCAIDGRELKTQALAIACTSTKRSSLPSPGSSESNRMRGGARNGSSGTRSGKVLLKPVYAADDRALYLKTALRCHRRIARLEARVLSMMSNKIDEASLHAT